MCSSIVRMRTLTVSRPSARMLLDLLTGGCALHSRTSLYVHCLLAGSRVLQRSTVNVSLQCSPADVPLPMFYCLLLRVPSSPLVDRPRVCLAARLTGDPCSLTSTRQEVLEPMNSDLYSGKGPLGQRSLRSLFLGLHRRSACLFILVCALSSAIRPSSPASASLRRMLFRCGSG